PRSHLVWWRHGEPVDPGTSTWDVASSQTDPGAPARAPAASRLLRVPTPATTHSWLPCRAPLSRGHHGRAKRNHGTDSGVELHPVGERLTGRAEQGSADLFGEPLSYGQRTPQRAPRRARRFRRNAGRDGACHPATVQGCADAAENCDAERSTELGAG